MKLPNRNYLMAQNKNLIRAGDKMVFLLKLNRFDDLTDEDQREAIRDWAQAKENLMGLAGRQSVLKKSPDQVTRDAAYALNALGPTNPADPTHPDFKPGLPGYEGA